MTSHLAVTSVAVAILTSVAEGREARFEFLNPNAIDDLAPLSVSQDGSVIAGSSVFAFSFEAFRWTAEGGAQLLGRATFPVLGVGGGTPDVSADGTRISATVLNETSQYATVGIWTIGKGWVTAELPDDYPRDCGPLDQKIGSAWGLSGDGQTVCGLYWRGGAVGGGSAHACSGSLDELADLGSLGPNRSSRANGASFNGSVVGGWSERSDGLWQPVVWVNGVMTQLGNYEAFCEVAGVRSDGLSLVGIGKVPTSFTIGDAFRWDWHAPSASWKETSLGSLPGTSQPFGLAMARAVTDDGSMIVGYNRFGAGNETGFVWTEATGMRSAADFLEANGSSVPLGTRILDLTDISADGSTIVGVALDDSTGRFRGFRILLSNTCPADLDGDGNVSASDLAVLLAAWGTAHTDADLDGDGSVAAADLSIVLAAWGDCG